MIELIDVCKTYINKQAGIAALKNINLHLLPGEIFGIIGPSGAGKSTLIRCVNLLERPTAGKVIVAGQELTQLTANELRQARRKIGMIFQHFNLLSSRTVYDNIALPLELSGHTKAEIAQIVLPLLELVDLREKQVAYPSQLSGGQKQRVAIARALVNQPKVLLCDEATSALDPHTTHTILQLLKNINEQLKLTILLITHEMAVVKEICHRLAILQHGEIVEQAEVIKFFGQPQTAVAKQFVRSAFKQHLPEKLQKRIVAEKSKNTFPLLQISFVGQASAEPIIAQIIQKFHIPLNILQANLEPIRNEMVGIMIVEMDAEETQVAACIDYLTARGLPVEIIGHVKRNDDAAL